MPNKSKLPTGLFWRGPIIWCGFSEGGRKICESTRSANIAEAKAFLRARREEVAQQVEAGISSHKRGYPFIEAAERYVEKTVAQLAPRHAKCMTAYIARLVGHFADTPVHAIDEPAVLKLLAERAGVSNATLNRCVLEPLQRILKLARKAGHKVVDIEWSELRRKERDFIQREVVSGEVDGLLQLPAPYGLIVEFARLSGLRQANCLLRKSQVELVARSEINRGSISATGKGGKTLHKTVSPAMEEVLREALANPTEAVFAFQRGGDWHPVTQSGLQAVWRRARAKGLVPDDLRFHDLRHDHAVKLRRSGADLATVQRALDHSNIATTMRYLYVTQTEVDTAISKLQRDTRPTPAGVVKLADRRAA